MVKQKKVTIQNLITKKQKGEKITALTAYDSTMGFLLDQTGIDIILVGDSCAMVVSGYESTLPMTVDILAYHTAATRRGVSRALFIADMPFLSYHINPDEAVRNAGRFFQECGAEAVKIEGGRHVCETAQRIINAGMPVMGHLGLTPQSIRKFGGYTLQGKTEEAAKEMIRDAKALEEVGVFSIVLEKIPAQVAKEITDAVSIPTIGIGAGPYCDGQILVTHDILGLYEKFKPKFVRQYAQLAEIIRTACTQYINDVKRGDYPNENESY